MKNVSLILYKDNKAYELTDLVESIKWKGRKGSAARSLSVTLIDSRKKGNEPADIDVTKGSFLIFSYNKVELFRGIVMSQQQTSKFKMPVVAYDNGIYLANNKDTFVYSGRTLHDIFIDVCNRFELKYSSVVKTSYKIPEMTKSKTTAWDVIQDAMSQDFKSTGSRYYMHSKKGVLSLVNRKQTAQQWVIETGTNLISYTYKKSIEDIRTRLKVYTDEDSVFAVRKNEALEKKIGIFQEVEKKDDKLTDAQVNANIAETLKDISTPEISLSVEAIGIPDIISGSCVYAIINDIGVKSSFYVDEDTHTFKGGSHTMSLTLNEVRK